MTKHHRKILALACCALWWNSPGLAEPKGGADAALVQNLRKTQGMLRQVAQEKADLEAKVLDLEAQLKAIDGLKARIKELEPLESQVKQQKANLDTLQAGNASLQQRISGDADRIRNGMEQQRKVLGELERFRRDNALLVAAVQERTQWIGDCAGKNQALLKANRDWIDQHGDKKLWDEIIAAEPFTGIAAVTQENAAEQFRYKLGDLEVTPWREPGAAIPATSSQTADAEPTESAATGDPPPAPNSQ